MKSLNALLLGLALALPAAAPAAEPVDINKADAKALAALDGVGDVKAQAIVAYRDQNGPFKSVDDLAKVKGIGDKTLERNRDNLTVGGAR
jgi:competence protein ComEA